MAPEIRRLRGASSRKMTMHRREIIDVDSSIMHQIDTKISLAEVRR